MAQGVSGMPLLSVISSTSAPGGTPCCCSRCSMRSVRPGSSSSSGDRLTATQQSGPLSRQRAQARSAWSSIVSVSSANQAVLLGHRDELGGGTIRPSGLTQRASASAPTTRPVASEVFGWNQGLICPLGDGVADLFGRDVDLRRHRR